MTNKTILERLAKINLQPKKANGFWECTCGNGKTYKNKNLKGLFGLPSKNAKELEFLNKKG